jgi:type II secretory pathway pseudopilin PulG
LVEIMLAVTIIALLAAIAIPNVLRGRMTANEAAALGNLRAVGTSLEAYHTVVHSYPAPDGAAFRLGLYGADCTAATTPVPDFGPPSFCRDLDGVAPNAALQGFLYTYTAPALGTSYALNADPQVLNVTGSRSFFLDQTGLIRHCTGSGATAGSNPLTEFPLPC